MPQELLKMAKEWRREPEAILQGLQTTSLPATGNALTWSQVTIEPGQDGTHNFSRRTKFSREHPLGILMTLAAKGEWRNPPGSSPEYDRVSKAFQRLQNLLRTLVPLPGKPFKKSAGAFVPLFKVWINAELLGAKADAVNSASDD